MRMPGGRILAVRIVAWGIAFGLAGCGTGDGNAGDADRADAVDVVPDPADLPNDGGPEAGDGAVDSRSDPADVPPGYLPPDGTIPEFVGGDRPAALYVPDDYTPEKAWPLLVVLHGYGVNGLIQASYLGLPERVTPGGFVLITPDGTVDADGQMFWNAFPSCCDFGGTGVDDVGYVKGLIAEAKAALNIDAGRVYLLGHSNGGFLSLRMACDASDVITAIASMAGSMTVDWACTPSRPVSVLSIHGTEDRDIFYGGGTVGGVPDYVSAATLVEDWKDLDHCSGEPVAGSAALDFDADVDGAETTTYGWSGCDEGTRVDHWKLDGSDHIPVFTEAFKDAVIGHLLALRRDVP